MAPNKDEHEKPSDEEIAKQVRASRESQGLPEKIEDLEVLQQIAAMLRKLRRRKK